MGNDDKIEASAAFAAKEYYRHKGFSGASTNIATARYIAALEAQIAMVSNAVAAERERCAKIAEQIYSHGGDKLLRWADGPAIAKAIRNKD